MGRDKGKPIKHALKSLNQLQAIWAIRAINEQRRWRR